MKVGDWFESEEEKLAFGDWAFGTSSVLLSKMYEEWNRLHGDLFIIEPNGYLSEDIPKMRDKWIELGKPKGATNEEVSQESDEAQERPRSRSKKKKKAKESKR